MSTFNSVLKVFCFLLLLSFSSYSQEIRIAYLVLNGEAEKKGLKRDDLVLAVDGYTGNDMEILRKLIQQEGKTIKITTKGTDGKVKEVELLLSRLI